MGNKNQGRKQFKNNLISILISKILNLDYISNFLSSL